jgi:hypothetical protein
MVKGTDATCVRARGTTGMPTQREQSDCMEVDGVDCASDGRLVP